MTLAARRLGSIVIIRSPSLPYSRYYPLAAVLGNLVLFVVGTIAAYEQLLAGGVVLLWDVQYIMYY